MAGTSPAMTVEGGFLYADPRDERLGSRAIVPRTKAAALANADAAAYMAHRIGLGVPSGGVDFAIDPDAHADHAVEETALGVMLALGGRLVA